MSSVHQQTVRKAVSNNNIAINIIMCYNVAIMDFEQLGTPVEIAPELQAITFEAIDDIRRSQEAAIRAAQMRAMHEGTAASSTGLFVGRQSRAEAKANVVAGFDGQIEQFVGSQIERDDNPERYDALLGFVKNLSITNMSRDKWRHGDLDATGEPDFHTSGRYLLEKKLEELSTGQADTAEDEPEEPARTPEEGPVDHESPEFAAAQTALGVTRKKFAELSVQGRQRSLKNGKKSKAFAAELQSAHDAYQAAYGDIIDMYITGYRDQGRSAEHMYEKLVPWTIIEQGNFSNAEKTYLETDDSIRSRATRFLSKRGGLFGLSIVSGAATGAVVRAVSKTGLALAVGVTGGAAAGALLGARAAKGALLSKVRSGVQLHKDFEKRRDQDKADLEAHLAGVTDKSEAEVRNAVIKVGAIALGRVESDRKTNLKRTLISTALGATAAAVAFELAPEIHELLTNGHDTPGGPDASTDGGTPAAPVTPHETPPTTVAGFDKDYIVKPGDGYEHVLQGLANEQGVHLSDAEAYRDVLKLVSPHGAAAHVFNESINYLHGNDVRIAHPGLAHLNAIFAQQFHDQLVADGKIAA
jgi:hypothetical protein